MMDGQTLFIGGNFDGRRQEIRGEPATIVLPILDFPDPFDVTQNYPGPVEMRLEYYRREHLYGANGQAFAVYAAGDQDIIALLLEGYRGRAE